MSKATFSSRGTVTKKEQITSASHLAEAGVMIFETQHPYYGYYGTTVPENPDTSSYFLVIRMQHTDERIIRAIQAVKESFTINFDAVPGRIAFNNKMHGAIRLKCIADKHIPELVDRLSDQGIEFIAKGKQTEVESLINISKYFETEEVEEGIFIDLNSETFAYLKISRKLDWEQFVSLTNRVRNNVLAITFDSAQAIMYDKAGIIDMVRVYSENRSVDNLRAIRKRYLEFLK